MADEPDHGDSYHGSTKDLVTEIRRMEKEKEELERKNRERQQLEQQLLQLKRNVSSLKTPGTNGSGTCGVGKGDGRNNQDSHGISAELSASLEQSQSQLRDLQQQVLHSSPVRIVEKEKATGGLSESFEEFEDDVMSAEHKQALRANRDVLVENMTPDDIFNDLISKHILTSSDVSRIKERNTVEAINEELLNVLVRRSDKAFHVFVSSLRRTLQGWLANRIDPNNIMPRNKRKRRTGELNIDVDCERVNPASREKYVCTCQEVEKQILMMAKGAFSNIRRRDASASSFEQFKKELAQTNDVIKGSLDLMNSLKTLCRHGDILDLSEGSVRFTIQCKSFTSCQSLWREYETGKLLAVFQRGINTPALLNICGAEAIYLRVRISRLEYISCALELGRKILLNEKRAKLLQRQLKRHLRSSRLCRANEPQGVLPVEEEKHTALGKVEAACQTYRRAFQEIPNNISTPQTLGSYTKFTSQSNKMTTGNDSFQTTFSIPKEDLHGFLYRNYSEGEHSFYSTSLGSSSSFSSHNQKSPIHKTRSIMRQKRFADTENLSHSGLLRLKGTKFKSTLKLCNYNLRTRTSENKERILCRMTSSLVNC